MVSVPFSEVSRRDLVNEGVYHLLEGKGGEGGDGGSPIPLPPTYSGNFGDDNKLKPFRFENAIGLRMCPVPL